MEIKESYWPQTIKVHNYYEVEVINKNNEVVSKAFAFNTAYSDHYNASEMIYTIKAIGLGEDYIEPYLDQEGHPTSETNYWERNGAPDFNNTGYKCTAMFIQPGSPGTITEIQLWGNSLMSSAYLQDIEGRNIVLDYGGEDSVRINAYIYFKANIEELINNNSFKGLYPIQYFGPNGSILCGCAGRNDEILEVSNQRPKRGGGYTSDGYLPRSVSNQIAITRSPIPEMVDGYLSVGIDNYQTFNPLTGTLIFKNSKPSTSWKGLITALVFPGIGLIDLATSGTGPLGQGIFKNNPVQKENNRDCFIPEEYVVESDSSLVSITKNAFYKAENVTVKRVYNNGIDVKIETVPLNECFFSPLIEDYRIRRSRSYSQPVPLTTKYCGAESIIPCSQGGLDDQEYYGYYIEYGTEIGSGAEQYLTANYAVTGEVLVYQSYLGTYDKFSFPYKLEYSYNGNDFFTAAQFYSASDPYTRVDFGQTISAPIWRITSTLSAGALYQGNTTFGDPRISAVAGDSPNGYDPLFIFVGYDRDSDERDEEELSEEELRSKYNTPNYSYTNKGANLPNWYHTTVPYLYHSDDTIFLSGELKR